MHLSIVLVFCWLGLFQVLIVHGLATRNVKEVTYKAAVLEYEAFREIFDEDGGAEVLKTNAINFANYALEAKKQGADILITPEYGLQSLDMETQNISKMITYSQYVPNPADHVAPWTLNTTEFDNIEGLAILSQAALDNSIYMVSDMSEVVACSEKSIAKAPFVSSKASKACPESGYIFYNTQVVFDRTGVVIARYRKQNLYGTESIYFQPGPLDDESAIFETDFDVVFTLEICFDVAHEHPGNVNAIKYGIKDMAMSTAWVDELPFALAHEYHNGNAHGLGINMLVSGYHLPIRSKLGSGIYKWYKNGPPVYVYNKDSGNVMLVAEVTTISKSELFSGPKKNLWSKWKQNKESSRFQYSKSMPHDVQEASKRSDYLDISRNSERLDDISSKHAISHQNLSYFSSTILPQTSPDERKFSRVCFDDFCCSLTYSHSGSQTYMLLALNGDDYVAGGQYKMGAQICSISWCRNEDITSCSSPYPSIPALDSFGPFQLSAKFASNQMTVMPEGLTGRYALLDQGDLLFNYDDESDEFVLSSERSFDDTLMLGLYGRWYGNDKRM